MRTVLIPLWVCLLITACQSQKTMITFKVQAPENARTVSIRGSVSPLSWEKALPLIDADGDHVFEISLALKAKKRNVKFKFTMNGQEELIGSDPRVLWFTEEPITEEFVYNEYAYDDAAQLAGRTYTEAQITEDVRLLGEVLQYVHPAVYAYRDSQDLQADLQQLEAEIRSVPSLVNAYAAISKFAATIKCSHTFTNPWNQGEHIEKALFSQPDKIPFTFHRIGRQLFIDKDASENNQLKKGLEILEINGVPVEEVLGVLTKYVASDGSNYEKKLERLTVTGEEKFALFDIFYPIAFGSNNQFTLQLKNWKTGEITETTVAAISKTKRSMILNRRYGSLETSIKDGWKFTVIDDQTAHLTLKSFAVQRNEFNWRSYLDGVFAELNQRRIQHLIIDIRGNEGGQGEVGEYLLQSIIREPLAVPAMRSSVRYLTIPDRFTKYISTWAKFPYDFTRKIREREGDRFLLKERYSVAGKTYRPRKNGFTGKVYLLTDASNSSATHLMAAYARQISNVTIVGQETGGNQLGTNGGFIFFLRLPNTKIVVDIPVINMFVPTGSDPVDGGIVPDIIVEKKVADFMDGTDTELEAVLQLIKTAQ